MSGRIVTAPEGVPNYLTAGKTYPVFEDEDNTCGFEIVDDQGDRIYCLFEGCAHLDGGDWIIATPGASK